MPMLPRAWGPSPGNPRGPGFVPPKPPKAPKPTTPKAPKTPKAPAVRVAPIDPNAQAQQNAMSAFRTALAQLQSSTPQVDPAAIYAPYRASQVVTGQLGAGLQTAVQNAGQAAQTQYGQGLDTAQQHATAFGISSGAGANQSALQNNGTQAIAQQTNAYSAAAPAAAAQWQQLLERTAAAKVSDAQLAREQGLTTAKQALSTALPGAIQNEKDLAFKASAQKFNEGLALSTRTDKQRAEMQRYGLDVAKASQSGAVAATRASQTAASNAERARHDRATEAAAARKLAQGDQSLAIKRRAQVATAKGLKGVAGAAKALQGGSTSASSKTVTGYNVGIIPGPNSVDAGANPRTVFAKDPAKVKIPAGWVRSGDPKPVSGPATTTKTTTSITPKQWDIQMRALLAQNPGQSAAVKAFLGPRPKK